MRSKTALIILFLMVLSTAAAAQSRRVAPTPTPPPDDIERIPTEEIKLNVLAFDESGKFFDGVGLNDLVITENDVLHQPTAVRRLPANVLIVLDTGGEFRSVKSIDQTKKTARAVVTALAPDDSVAVLQYSDRAEIIGEWTNDKKRTLDAINRAKFGKTSAFIAALNLSRDFLEKNPLDNRHLVLITDGTDSSGDRDKKLAAFNALLATDISVHVLSYTRLEAIDSAPRTKVLSNSPPPKAMPDEINATLPPGVRRDPQTQPRIGPTINMDRKMLKTMKNRKADLEASELQLAKVTTDSNGEFIVPESIDEMIEKAPTVARMIDSSYVVTYIPKAEISGASGPKERNIMVTSKRPGLVVEARRRIVISGN
jgi:Mg-chelatase subunit ChlD